MYEYLSVCVTKSRCGEKRPPMVAPGVLAWVLPSDLRHRKVAPGWVPPAWGLAWVQPLDSPRVCTGSYSCYEIQISVGVPPVRALPPGNEPFQRGIFVFHITPSFGNFHFWKHSEESEF